MKIHSILKAVLLTALALCLALGCVLTAAAANSSLPPATGSLTIHKYVMPDTSFAGAPYDGTVVPPESLPETAVPLNGVEFKLYKLTIPAGGTVPSDAVFPDPGYLFESYLNPLVLRSDGIDYPLSFVTSVTTAGGTAGNPLGVATASNLAQGFYLVVEQPNEKVVNPCAPFVLAVPMTNADGDGWIQDVHVYPKNEDVSLHKQNNKTVVDLGDTVTWTVTSSVPTDVAAFSKFDIVDPLDEALDFNLTALPNSAILKLEGLQAESDASGTPIDPALYDVTLESVQDLPTPAGAHTEHRKTLRVSFKKSGSFTLPSGESAPAVPGILANYKFIRMTFVTTVNEKILNRADYTVWNGAKIELTNRYGQEKERISEEQAVHTAKIIINKIDANTGIGANVNGAQFKLATSEANANNGHYIHVVREGNSPTGAIIRVCDYGESGYNDVGMTDWVETASGGTATLPAIAVFAGLQDYTESSVEGDKTYLSYWIVETQAPGGYNLLSAPVKLSFTADSKVAEVNHTIECVVKNTTDFELPNTGGIGTILFTAGGILLLGAAVALVVIALKKRKGSTD
ncbi:MAG: SpaH/EbpB family LPXTG-anchored major pilin [Clostridium sp.]|jgi:fimbrial isopeptide formation D2 family protein/LPXTG-motif cell wall-anchored protein|nr:SpaH/EbpB family LPXTG-anchored major pilin [Clostridium sp.]